MREKEESGNAERKAIISQHPDAMTAADRQGELQLIAKLSSLLSTNPSSQCSLSLPIISLCAQRENSSTPSAIFDYNTNSSAACVYKGVWTHMLVLTFQVCVCVFVYVQLLVVCVCMCMCVCCFSKRLQSWSPLSAVALSKQMPQCCLSFHLNQQHAGKGGGGCSLLSLSHYDGKQVSCANYYFSKLHCLLLTTGNKDVLCTHLKYYGVLCMQTGIQHTYIHTASLCWTLQQPISRVKPPVAWWPETYMSVEETGEGAKLKMIVSWWAVSGVLDLDWLSHYKSLMLLNATTVTIPKADICLHSNISAMVTGTDQNTVYAYREHTNTKNTHPQTHKRFFQQSLLQNFT